MPRNTDIRLIDGDLASAAEAIKEFLPLINFQIDQEKKTESNVEIKSSNLQKSFFKLYLSNCPQIITWKIKQKADGQVQIEVECNLFTKFRVIYLTCLSLLSVGFTFFFISSTTDKINPLNKLGLFNWFSGMSSDLIIAIIFLILAFVFYLRSINGDAYDSLVNRFYEFGRKKPYGNEINVQNALGFPDTWKCFFLFVFFIFITLFYSEIDIPNFKHSLPSYFIGGAILTIGILVTLLFLMVTYSAIATRVIFTLTGFALCVPIIMYSNTPIVLSYSGDINNLMENHFKIGSQYNFDVKDPREQDIQKNYPQKFVRRIATFYLSSWLLIIIVASILMLNLFRLPIYIIRDLSKFSSKHPESNFYHALHPDKIFGVFNFVILLLWMIISIANIFGLYFSLSIIEKTFSNSPALFDSEFSTLFFNNTRTAFILLSGSNSNSIFISLLHKLVMLIYSIPMIIIFIFVLIKNITAVLEGYSLLKRQTKEHSNTVNQLSEKIKHICKFVNVRMPIIKITDSPDIYAETKFLSFPLFKNILIVSYGTWIELQDKEDELNSLLAHEIWHIKKHTLIRRLLCFLSDYSLFGNGFLAVLQNSFKIEKEADDFAVKWLINKYHDPNKAINALKSLLERIEEINWRNRYFPPAETLNFAMLKEDPYRIKILEEYGKANRIVKFKINLTILYQLYFGEEIISYFHPSISQRKAWAGENYGTTETN